MKRAAHQARRRRFLRRWSFVAAFGATTALGVFGSANDGSLGSFFSTKKAKPAHGKADEAAQPAPIMRPAEVESNGHTGASTTGRFIRPASGSKRLPAPVTQSAVRPAAITKAADAKQTEAKPAPVTQAPGSPLSSYIGAPKARKPGETSTQTRVTLLKTDQPAHVRPSPLNIGHAKPLQEDKRNAFLDQSRVNRYNEPRALSRGAAKPLDSNSQHAEAAPKQSERPTAAAPVLTGEQLRNAKQNASSRVATPAPVRQAKPQLEIRLEPQVATSAGLSEQTAPSSLPAAAPIAKPKYAAAPNVVENKTAQRPKLTTRPAPQVKKPATSKLPAFFADAARRPTHGPRRTGTPVRTASNQLRSEDAPALESPQQDPRFLTPGRARQTPAPRDFRVARALQQDNAAANDGDSHFEVIDEAGRLTVEVGRSRLLKCKFGVFRTAIVDPTIVESVQFTPTEVSLIGKRTGATQVTFWFENDQEAPKTYLVEVQPSERNRENIKRQYDHLEDLLADIFPDSKIRLTLVADKLVVRGQAKDSAEAAQIMSIIRGQSGGRGAQGGGMGISAGIAAQVFQDDETGQGRRPQLQVINMLNVPGVQQVALRVKIAELNRSAARGAGIDIDADIEINGNEGALLLKSMLNAQAGNAPALIGEIDQGDVEIGLRWLRQHGIIRVVSEPTLVTLSGTAATFVAGGEFAVPTVVGTGGLSAVTTDFRAFGAIISFMPTVVDKDRIRLQVSPEFSKIDQDLNVGGTPGLQVRAVTTTVEMREGQTLAIAGLLDDALTSDRTANLPWLERIINTRDTTRNETELIILVTPELVHPMDPEEVPPLPGFDVTEPTDKEFYYHSRLEGHPARQHRSTIWPRLRRRYGAGGSSMISGPFGHGQ